MKETRILGVQDGPKNTGEPKEATSDCADNMKASEDASTTFPRGSGDEIFLTSGRTTAEGDLEMMGDQQERRYRRFQLRYPVRVKYGPSAEIETLSKNVSIGGLLVRSTSMIPEQTPVSFVISIQGGLAVQPIYLAGEGEIVRVQGRDAPFELAVECKAIITQLQKYLPTT